MTKRFKNTRFLTVAIILLTTGRIYAQHQATDYQSTIPVSYIRTWDATAPLTDPNALTNSLLREAKQSTQYFDGLGRPLQTVLKQGSLVTGSAATDLVSPVEYDALGREQYKWLPYAETTDNNGNFKQTPFTKQLAFYNNPNGILKGQGESYYYNQTFFEASPLNRSLESFAAGISWAGTADQTTHRSIKMKYWFNTVTDDVKMWSVTDAGNSFGSYAVSTVNNGAGVGVYAAGELQKNIMLDEHNKQVVEFKDKEGRVILKKVQLTATSDAGTGSGYPGWMSTYYIYDDLGNLRCMIQPEGVKALAGNNWQLSSNSTLLNEQCFRYEYDYRNRMSMKKVPGAGEVYMVYDKRDRLVMTQDANMRTGGTAKWLVTLYDNFNRPVQTGLWSNSSSRQTHEGNAQNGSTYYYPFDATTVPSSDWEKLTTTHYDNYTGLPSALSSNFNSSWNSYFAAASNSYPYPQALTAITNTLDLVTWTETKVLDGNNNFLSTVMIYDDKARVIQTQSTNITGGIDISSTQYNWVGQPLVVVQKQQKQGSTNAQTTVVVTQLSYDDLGRLLKTEKKLSNTLVNNNAMPGYKTITENQYDALGRLKTKKLAPQYNSNMGLETESFDYNIRGWMLGMNRDYTKDNNSSNYFGFDLGYDKASNGLINNLAYTKAQYNGNIGGMVWKTKGDREIRKYDFDYDAASRLLKADFTQYTGGTFNQNAGVKYDVTMGSGATLSNGELDPTSAYDDNGNIKRMQQWGLKLNASGKIDDLVYTYMFQGASNKLQQVIDLENDNDSKLGDFKYNPSTKTNTDYTYDDIGNLVTDANKIFTAITYNYLNLPYQITKPSLTDGGGGTITYTYDAAGNKLKKEVNKQLNSTAFVLTTTTYINGLVYESRLTSPADPANPNYTDVLQFIPQEEGRIRFKPATGNIAASFEYDYMLKDHLGNVRMVLTEEQQKDIYPAVTLEPSLITTENTFYTIDQNKIKPNTAATGIQAYYNNNIASTGTPVNNNNPNCSGNLCTTDNSQYVYQLDGSTGNKTGLGITLKVMSGDKIDVYGKSYYNTNNPNQNGGSTSLPILDILTGFLGSPGATGTTGIHGIVTPPEINTINGTGLISGAMLGDQNNQLSGTYKPRAFINVIFFDEQFKAVDYKVSVVGSNNSVKDHASELQNLTVPKNGFVYIYCSNETPVNVFFDNIQVVHNRSAILEETHYYPFGLTMARISSKAAGEMNNKEKTFQGQRFDDDLGLNWIQFKWRNHDPQIGRFIEIDPLSEKYVYNSTYAFSENKVVRHVELEGLESWDFMKTVFNSAGLNDQTDGPRFVKQTLAKLKEPDTYGRAVLGMGPILGGTLIGIFTGGVGEGAFIEYSVGQGVRSEVTTAEVSSAINLEVRAKEIHSALPAATQEYNTTAVGMATTSEGKSVTLVSSNEFSLRAPQIAALKPGEIPVSGLGHAEPTMFDFAAKNNMTLTSIGTSRPICVDCAHSAALLPKPINLASPISTTKTKINYGNGPTLPLIPYPIK